MLAQSGPPQQAGRATGAQAGQQPPPPQEQRPIFRGRRELRPGRCLRDEERRARRRPEGEDFEISRTADPQKGETFELVKIQTGATPPRDEPRTVRESREMAADPRARVFVLFLDTYHVGQGSRSTSGGRSSTC